MRNTAPAKQEMTVIALCGEYFRVKLPASYDFGDDLNQDTEYVQKQLVEISVSSMTINDVDKEIVLTIGDYR